jgi:HlyD family secretion protein
VVTDGLPGTTAERLQIPDVQRRARGQRWLVLGVLCAGVVAGIFWYGRRAQAPSELYRCVPIARQDVVRVVEATGHLDARARFEVPAVLSGRLSEVLVRVGDSVQRGQVLARLDDRVGEFAVRNASASHQAASWHMAEAKSSVEAATEEQARVERLAARGLASSQELASAKSTSARAGAALAASRAEQSVAQGQLASARFSHTQGEIVAPNDGVVLIAPENLGAAVSPELPLFVIGAPLERMRVDVDVSEADIGEVKVGQPASFDVQAYPGRSFGAEVERVGVEPRREAGVVTYPVRLIASNPDRALLPGMTASVQVKVARVEKTLVVRDAALRFTPPGSGAAESRTRLFRRLAPMQLEIVPVSAGLSDGAFTEVHPRNGARLDEGDEIAVGFLRADAADHEQPGITLGNK